MNLDTQPAKPFRRALSASVAPWRPDLLRLRLRRKRLILPMGSCEGIPLLYPALSSSSFQVLCCIFCFVGGDVVEYYADIDSCGWAEYLRKHDLR